MLLCAWVGCGSHDHDHDHGAAEHGHGHDHGAAEHGHDHGAAEHGHGHGHGEGVAIGITRWTDTLELFAEHPPAVTGQEVPFLAHLTILKDFRALETAQVTLVLDGPGHVEAKVMEMLRPGIFQPVFTAPAPGEYQARLEVTGPEVEDTVSGFGITVYESAEAAARANPDQEDDGAAISFLKEQQWQVRFATAFAVQDTVVPAIEVSGEVTTPPRGQAEVGAAISGRVVAPNAGLAQPGQSVKKGQLLALIAPAPASPEQGARADLAVVEAQARVEAARAAVERAERLIADRAIPQRQVDDARRELRVAEQALQAARRAAALFTGAASGRGAGTYRLTSPINGVITEVRATQGKSVTAGERLFHVVNLSELWIRARVPEQDATRLRADQDAAYQLPGLDIWLPIQVRGEGAGAAVVNVGQTVDPRSRTVDVIYALSAPDPRLRVGARVRVSVPAGDAWSGVVVPRSAVLDSDGKSVVYVQAEGEAFMERTVRLGPSAGPHAGVASGVAAGERVVTEGANVIRLSARASSAPAHGHVH